MKVALIGYGKMGKEIERLATEKGWTITHRLNSRSPGLTATDAAATDVAIHFASPSSVLKHVEEWAAFRKNLIIGTTGWQNQLPQVKAVVEETGIGVVYASNFSPGVNLFFRFVKDAGRLLNKFTEYDASIHEVHHKDKADSPSGTALTLGKLLLEELRGKKEILAGNPQGKIRPEQLQITSARTGAVVGTHTVTFDSAADTIILRHSAKNRNGFAQGALLAAQWVQSKRGFFTMDEVLADLVRP